MTVLALALVFASAIAHATWNYLAKSSRDTYAFSWAFTTVAGLMYVPIALIVTRFHPLPLNALYFIGGTVLLHVLYFWLLNASYARADLSVVYPMARGTSIICIPVGAALLLDEHVSVRAAAAICLIVIGILVVHSRGSGRKAISSLWLSFRDTGAQLALLTGLVIACYSLWDKHALTVVPPIVQDAGIFAGQAVINLPITLHWRRRAVLREICERPWAVLAAGILSPLAYLLVLTALTFSRVAYIAPSREIGIVIGTLLGTRTLGEAHASNRILGSCLIVGGVFALALFG
ncbi:MAG: DMT family transporter [Chloroflexi bacterium]|nr:DMT family transporter [Chloroflexota bacterium]